MIVFGYEIRTISVVVDAKTPEEGLKIAEQRYDGFNMIELQNDKTYSLHEIELKWEVAMEEEDI